MSVIFGLLMLCGLFPQMYCGCTPDEITKIGKCRGGGQFYYIYHTTEQGISGMSEMLLVNLTQGVYEMHCRLLSEYTDCISSIQGNCHTKMQKDALFEGIYNYYSFLCARSYADYSAAVECRGAISKLNSVKSCDKQSEEISLVPNSYGGVCGNATAWMNCYTEATASECKDTADRKSAVYVLTAQYKLLQKLGEAAKCQGQDFPDSNNDETSDVSSGGVSGGSGWIHAVWISVVALCIVVGVIIYLAYRKRQAGIPRQRLVNEVA